MYSIAIDGPTGAGKSTVARAVAKYLNYIYVDTGALYRAIGYTALKKGIDVKDISLVEELLKQLSISIEYVDSKQHVFVNEVDVTDSIRTEDVSMAASSISAHAAVRTFLLELQRSFARQSNVIMDGRDIATVVLPNADVKIFLTATSEERARRRQKELVAKGLTAEYEDVLADLMTRDYNDSHRPIAPLVAAADSIIVDTTNLTFEEVVELIVSIVKEKVYI